MIGIVAHTLSFAETSKADTCIDARTRASVTRGAKEEERRAIVRREANIGVPSWYTLYRPPFMHHGALS